MVAPIPYAHYYVPGPSSEFAIAPVCRVTLLVAGDWNLVNAKTFYNLVEIFF
jgi:hypothetical protein